MESIETLLIVASNKLVKGDRYWEPHKTQLKLYK